MITIVQLLESVDLDFEPRFVTKDECGCIKFFSDTPRKFRDHWICDEEVNVQSIYPPIKISDFANKKWQECIYEVPRKTTGKIEKFVIENDRCGNVEWWDVVKKINQIVDYVNALIESNNIHEKQIDELQMKIEPEKCAINELKGAKNE